MSKIFRLTLPLHLAWLSCHVISAATPNLGLHISGTSYVEVTNSISLSRLNAFTFEAYILFEVGGTDNPRIISKGWEANGGLEFGFVGTGNSRQLFIDGLPTPTVRSTNSLQANIWYHVAVAFAGGSGYFAINGQLDSSFTANIQTTNNFPLNLGRNSGNGNDHFSGYLDEVRIWNRKLTIEEIDATMYSVLNGTEVGLVAYWNFDSGTAKDLTSFANDGVLKDASIEPISLSFANSLQIYTAVEVDIQSPPGQIVQLQTSTNLIQWADFGLPIAGTGLPAIQFFPTHPSVTTFYRIKP